MLTVALYLLCLVIFDQSAAEVTLLEKDPTLVKKFSWNSGRDEESHQHSHLLCDNSSYSCAEIKCSEQGPLLTIGYCATYDGKTKLLSICRCSYFQPTGYNITNSGYVKLPRNLSQLNDYMCGPLNRKGIVCSECADGFGPSATSFGYECANCTDAWYGVPLFLVVEFVPITVFYLIILVFQISVTSAPMPCFIMYAQWIVVSLDVSMFSSSSLRHVMFTEEGEIRLDMKIIQTFYRFFNLDFFLLILPKFCISDKISSIYLAFLAYISVVYPFFLIFLTWVCIELHGRNFRPLVWIWRPFHKCFVRLRRGWNTKSDITDVFATFFIFSYGKCTFQTILLYTGQDIRNFNETGIQSQFVYQRVAVDLSIPQLSTHYFMLVIPASLLFLVYSILPPLLLIFYPFKVFRSCLSKCRLDFITVNIFVEKINCCYKDGLDGRRDMRSFSGLYFFLRKAVYLTGLISYRMLNAATIRKWSIAVIWFPTGTLFLFAALTIALVKPYRKVYMNYVDTLLLVNLALFNYLMTAEMPVLLIARVFLVIPIIAFIGTIFLRKSYQKCRLQKCFNCCQFKAIFTAGKRSQRASSVSAAASIDEQIPILPPSQLELGYGTN